MSKATKRKFISGILAVLMIFMIVYIPDMGVDAKQWMGDANGWWYLEDDGSYPVSEWKYIDDVWYYFDETGYVVTGWQKINGIWYYFDADSCMVTGWQKIDSKWYYFNSDGAMHTGWLASGGNWYYLKSDGDMAIDWVYDGSAWYLMDASGKWIDNNKIIYLTFDDGPSPYTNRLLGILDKYNVKATFFVTGAYPGYASCIARAYNAGHSIGVHSYTHNYSQIYASEEAYWADFERVEDLIVQQTGHRTNLFRFPGGSSNHVSMFNEGIMTRLAYQAGQKGYTYFDWNVMSGDAGLTTKSSECYQNLVTGVKSRNVSVVLCHDSKSYTVDAMEDFISWALSNGYTFLPLTENSPTAHQTIAN